MSIKLPSESVVLAGCLQLLKLAGVFCWRANTGGAYMDGGGRRRFVRFGPVGCADILAALPPAGKLLAVECKRPGGKATPSQRAFLQAVNDAGGLGVVIDDVQQLEELLRREGIL
jgi:hypothetical protein